MKTKKVDYSIPLTSEQARIVEEKHNLIYAFLNKYRLPVDDYYGAAAEGLIRAVQRYTKDEKLWKYKLTTIAFSCMRTCVYNERRKLKRHMKHISLDCPVKEDGDLLGNMVSDPQGEADLNQIQILIDIKEIFKRFSAKQRDLVRMRIAGINRPAMARHYKVLRDYIDVQLNEIRELFKREYY